MTTPLATSDPAAKDVLAPTGPAIGPLIGTVVRVALGALFIYMGLVKAIHPEEFLKLVRQYHLIRSPYVLNTIAAGLPWFEVFCGLLLVFGIAVRGAASVILVMLLFFSGVVLRRALAIHGADGTPFEAIKFDCGCGSGAVVIVHKLLENLGLMLLALVTLCGGGRLFAVRHDLLKRF
jgi:putative oxidoreductase